MVTLKPRDWSNLARDAAMMPLPSEEVTPPVTKMYFVLVIWNDCAGHVTEYKVNLKVNI